MFGLPCCRHLPEFSDSTLRNFLTQLSSFSDSRSPFFRLPFPTQRGCFRHLPHSVYIHIVYLMLPQDSKLRRDCKQSTLIIPRGSCFRRLRKLWAPLPADFCCAFWLAAISAAVVRIDVMSTWLSLQVLGTSFCGWACDKPDCYSGPILRPLIFGISHFAWRQRR